MTLIEKIQYANKNGMSVFFSPKGDFTKIVVCDTEDGFGEQFLVSAECIDNGGEPVICTLINDAILRVAKRTGRTLV